MNGLIGGILRGTGQTLQQIGTANAQANIEAEKAAAQEARDMRLLEVRQTYATQNTERESELRLGNTVLESQLRGELTQKELDARAKENQLNRDATIKSAQISAGSRNNLSPAEAQKLEYEQLRADAIKKGDRAAVAMYDEILQNKPTTETGATIKERKDAVGNVVGYDYVSPSGYRPIPQAGGGGIVGSQIPGGTSGNPRVSAFNQMLNKIKDVIGSATPSSTTKPDTAKTPPRGDDRRGVENARKSQLTQAINSKQAELRAIPNDNLESSKLRAMEINSEIQNLMRERDKSK